MPATFEQVMGYLEREARALSIDVDAWSDDLFHIPVLLHAKGLIGAKKSLALASKMDYGSVVFIRDFPENIYDVYNEAMASLFFRQWDKFGTDYGRTWVKSIGDFGYGSHIPILAAAVVKTTGPVLELGSGFASTEVLHEICATQNRLLVTIDNQKDWFRQFEDLKSNLHVLELNPDIIDSPWLMKHHWGVAFVDHAPGETRAKAVEILRDRSEMVIVHDSEEIGYQLEPIFDTFAFRKDFRRHRPWVSALSMTTKW